MGDIVVGVVHEDVKYVEALLFSQNGRTSSTFPRTQYDDPFFHLLLSDL